MKQAVTQECYYLYFITWGNWATERGTQLPKATQIALAELKHKPDLLSVRPMWGQARDWWVKLTWDFSLHAYSPVAKWCFTAQHHLFMRKMLLVKGTKTLRSQAIYTVEAIFKSNYERNRIQRSRLKTKTWICNIFLAWLHV